MERVEAELLCSLSSTCKGSSLTIHLDFTLLLPAPTMHQERTNTLIAAAVAERDAIDEAVVRCYLACILSIKLIVLVRAR